MNTYSSLVFNESSNVKHLSKLVDKYVLVYTKLEIIECQTQYKFLGKGTYYRLLTLKANS